MLIYLHTLFLASCYDNFRSLKVDFVEEGPVVTRGRWRGTVEHTADTLQSWLQILTYNNQTCHINKITRNKESYVSVLTM